jgi:hypothetical protein
MRGRMVLLGFLLCLASACAWARRPYAEDPLLRDGRGIWGNPRTAAMMSLPAVVEPTPPAPPYPENLPTLEWERYKVIP